jgi:RNase P subunit RPR2
MDTRRKLAMNCWHCNTELIWGGDHDISDENEDYLIVTNLSCPNCDCIVDVYFPKDEESP